MKVNVAGLGYSRLTSCSNSPIVSHVMRHRIRQNMPNMFDLEHLFLSSRMKGFGGTSVGSSTSLELYVGLSGEFNRLEASSVGVVYSVIRPPSMGSGVS